MKVNPVIVSADSGIAFEDLRASTLKFEMNEKEVDWSVYACAQNLSAILNDPNRSKQKDFFTKTWGESFVDTAPILPSPRLEDVPNAYFAPYCRKLLKRYRKLQERKSSTSIPTPQDPLHPFFPQLAARETIQILKPETSPIPRIYFTPNFTLTNSETFREVFSVDSQGLPSRLIQDKLSHYLDLVEVGLAQQISKKSSAFFSAVSTQDKVAEKVSQALTCVQLIKKELTQVKEDHVIVPLKIVSIAKKKSNLNILYQKLQLMSTVHQAQRAIQSLLGNSDYVGALDLISTTQEVLRQELQGLVSFRHLDSQLVEIRNAIEKMLRADLERNLSADLNRPIDQMVVLIDKDRLVSIILGYLRIGKVVPIVSVLAKEITTAMTTTGKQTLIEAVSESDSKSDSLIGSNAVQMAIPHLSTELWIKMISQLGQRLVQLLQHIKEVITLFQHCGNSAVGQSTDSIGGSFLTEHDEPIISIEIYTTFIAELSNQLEKSTTTADEKFTSILRHRRTWYNREEFFATLEAVRDFVASLEVFANSLVEGSAHKTLRYTSAAEIKTQTSEFFRSFHQKQTEAVNLVLDREKWRVAPEDKVKNIYSSTAFVANNSNKLKSSDSSNTQKQELHNNSENGNNSEYLDVRTAEIFFVLLRVIAEYAHLVNVTGNAEIVLGVVDLLRNANARVAHLVLGAGAVELKITKSITVANLAVVVRGLCLLSSVLPEIKEGFKQALPSKNHHLLKHVDAVNLEICRHSEDVEHKMVSILGEVIDAELLSWEARPPVPSTAINNVSKNIFKFRDAIGTVLTQKQISDLFIRVDKVFRSKLKERIASLGIQKDGGPRHGVVTSEMMHYAENLRKLNVLPANVVSNAGLTQELWTPVKKQ
ncbi:unnamed protein product [Allacma fusca]|uniref:Vacuolar protein sorting-associated protein 54 n=1 Tax=Allacma fusca TaxID=39272 RepID=A0A8J2JTA7_9HEXA|nr:unnamed protein product [Allacma fusca]